MGFDRSLDTIPAAEAVTLDGLFRERVRRTPSALAYRWYDRADDAWKTLGWAEAEAATARWRAALAREGLQAGDRVAVLLRNCPEWAQFDLAALSMGLVTVPLYTDDRPENAAYILGDCDARVLLIQDAGRWSRLSKLAESLIGLQRVVLLELRASAQGAADADGRIVTAEDWLPVEGMVAPERSAESGELATIVYTSGTTGRSKGVMLSHANLLSNCEAALTMLEVYPEDLFLSFLPLSHTLERMAGYYVPIMAGSGVAYARSIAQLADDLKTLRPTLIIAVPRVFERLYARIHDQVQKRPAPAQRLFRLAESVGWMAFEHGQGRRAWHPALLLWPLLQKLVAKPIMERLGGRLRASISGGAPLPPKVSRLFCALGLPLLQGYGLTETSPVISVNSLERNLPQSVGLPIPGIEVCIGDNAELLVRGPNVMLGYWNNAQATAALVDEQGWLHSGDQARMEDGHLYITGRLKDVLVLSNGEKVPPGDMEMAIGLDPLFEQVMVIGEGRSFLTALVVLEPTAWASLAASLGVDAQAPGSLEDGRVVKRLLERIRSCLVDFPGYAKVRRVSPHLAPWTVDNGLITPTLKVRRKAVLERYRDAVDGMYD